MSAEASLSSAEKFLDWAWNEWQDFRAWMNPEKTIQPAGEDTARDDIRLLFKVVEDCAFFLGVRCQSGTIRVGLATTNRWVSEGIEQAVLDSGGSMTEFLEDEMEADDELQWPMIHYYDAGEFYFHSEIPFEDLDSPELCRSVGQYFEGYVMALEGRLEGE